MGRESYEDVAARSRDGERRGADELNLELRRRIPVDVALQDPPTYRSVRRKRPAQDEGLVAAHEVLASILVRSIWSPFLIAPSGKTGDYILEIDDWILPAPEGVDPSPRVIVRMPARQEDWQCCRVSAPAPPFNVESPGSRKSAIVAGPAIQGILAIIAPKLIIAGPAVERAAAENTPDDSSLPASPFSVIAPAVKIEPQHVLRRPRR